MIKELIGLLLPLLALLIRHFIYAKLDQREVLESIRKEQKQLNETATQVLEQGLEASRSLRSSVQELQDQMDDEMSHSSENHDSPFEGGFNL